MGSMGLLDHPWITRWKLDVDEYHRMGEAGILTEDDRVELIEGELIKMAPIGCPHASTANALTYLLVTAVGRRGIVAAGNPVRLDRYSEPQPDFAVLRPHDHRYRERPPGPEDVLLLVEVADTSLRYDRAVKLPLYARHGIPEVWIVDIGRGLVELCREPGAEGYASITRAGRDITLEPALLPGITLPVADILG